MGDVGGKLLSTLAVKVFWFEVGVFVFVFDVVFVVLVIFLLLLGVAVTDWARFTRLFGVDGVGALELSDGRLDDGVKATGVVGAERE